MSYSCGCSGGQCGNQGGSGVDRRDFLKAAAAAGGLAALGLDGNKAAAQTPQAEEALRAWTADLWQRGERRVYRGEELTHIAMPLGGVGAGQVYLTGRGRLTQWQIVNNFNSSPSSSVSGGFFAVRASTPSGGVESRLLQEGNDGPLPGVTAIEFSGEFPYGWLQYLDGRLPVRVSLEAHTPLVPLNADDSGLPAALFRFTVANSGREPVEVSLLASMPNLVGWDGYTRVQGVEYAEFLGNRNRVEPRPGMTYLRMETQTGAPARFDAPRDLYANDREVLRRMRLCENVTIQPDRITPDPDRAQEAVIWLSLAARDAASIDLEAVEQAVNQGAALVISGEEDGIVGYLEAFDTDRTVFEDWESGTYEGWTVEGDCFGSGPVTGTLPGQQPVSGWNGAHYVNTFHNGDVSTGRAVSRPFTVEKRYIHLQVGGGNHPGETCVNLRVGGAVVRSVAGENSERLRPVRWDVSEYSGQTATLEIVDTHTGGWGHILVGDIVFSDAPVAPFADPASIRRLREALPFSWTRSERAEGPASVAPGPWLGESGGEVRGHRRLEGFTLKDGARVVLEAQDGAPLVVVGRHGNGAILVCNGDIPGAVELGRRATVRGRLMAEAAGLRYSPQTGWSPDSPFFGSMGLAVLDAAQNGSLEVTACPQWDDPAALLRDFADRGRLEPGSNDSSVPGRTWNGALCASLRLEPGETRDVTFALAWHFPNRTRDSRYGWGPPDPRFDHRLGNRYNRRFRDAAEVMDHLAAERERLETATRAFHAAVYDSTLPRWLLDAVTANIANIRSPLCIWLEDGTFGGFEGTDCCCPMNCTHVYNYVMTLAYLFPELERNVRETDLLVQMHPERHFIPHRTVLPLSQPRLGDEIGGPHHHALDGELGTLLKLYREWRHDGDREWLEKLWPNARKVMEHVMTDHDVDGDGVIRGVQPNTYDTHLYGSNTFIGSLYLAALRAMEEMARALGDDSFANRCRERYESGRAGYDRTCWNGEYYENIYDAPDASPETYNQDNCYGPGCHCDQVLGQWWAWLLDLGDVLPRDHVQSALEAVYRHNWRADLSNHVHNQRNFAEGREKGLLTATWPRGGRPERPILYCDEVWTGLEYHVAASLIYLGLVEPALQIVKGARDRYTGDQRNPFAEIECGAHYARALSSYSLLPALAGFSFDAPNRSLAFRPRVSTETFRCFFTAGRAWGSLARERAGNGQKNTVRVDGGTLELARLVVAPPAEGRRPKVEASLGGAAVPARCESDESGGVVVFTDPVRISAGETLEVTVQA